MNRSILALALALLASPGFVRAQTNTDPNASDPKNFDPNTWTRGERELAPPDKTYVDMTVPKMKAEQFIKDHNAFPPTTDASGQTGTGTTTPKTTATSGTKHSKRKTAPKTTPDQTTTTGTGTTETTGTGTTQTTGAGTTETTGTGTTETTGTGTTTPLDKKNFIGPPTEAEYLEQLKNAQKEGPTLLGSPTFDNNNAQTTTVSGKDGKDDGKKKNLKDLFTKNPKKDHKAPPDVGPNDEKDGKKEGGMFADLFHKKKTEPDVGPITGKAVKGSDKDFPNIVGGAKYGVYAGLLTAMFATGPLALGAIVLAAAIGFAVGYFVTKKNG